MDDIVEHITVDATKNANQKKLTSSKISMCTELFQLTKHEGNSRGGSAPVHYMREKTNTLGYGPEEEVMSLME